MIKLGLSIPNTCYEGSHNRASNIDIDEDSDQSLDLVLFDLSVKEAFVHMQ